MSTLSSYAENLAAASLVEQISLIVFYVIAFAIMPGVLILSDWRDKHPRRRR